MHGRSLRGLEILWWTLWTSLHASALPARALSRSSPSMRWRCCLPPRHAWAWCLRCSWRRSLGKDSSCRDGWRACTFWKTQTHNHTKSDNLIQLLGTRRTSQLRKTTYVRSRGQCHKPIKKGMSRVCFTNNWICPPLRQRAHLFKRQAEDLDRSGSFSCIRARLPTLSSHRRQGRRAAQTVSCLRLGPSVCIPAETPHALAKAQSSTHFQRLKRTNIMCCAKGRFV